MSLAFEAVLDTASEVVEALRKAERRSVRRDCRSTAREAAKDMTSSPEKEQENTQRTEMNRKGQLVEFRCERPSCGPREGEEQQLELAKKSLTKRTAPDWPINVDSKREPSPLQTVKDPRHTVTWRSS